MENFDEYYNEQFQKDLHTFFATIPDNSKFHEDLEGRATYSIQYERLTRDFNHLDFLINQPDKINFAVALFFTVLVDEVCYTQFREHYESFRKMTFYPKFIGNCPGGCHYHLHPSDIFAALNYSRKNQMNIISSQPLYYYGSFISAVPIIEREIKDFFKIQFPSIDGQTFWIKCVNEFPYRLNNEMNL